VYLNNQQLAEAMRQINEVLGQKLDILGMDACMMQMLEVGYQVRKYADYVVASQEVELAQGWDYSAFLAMLAKNRLTPEQLAQNIVQTFGSYYGGKYSSFGYTQSAVKCDCLELLKANVDAIAQLIAQAKATHGSVMRNIIYEARRASVQFNTPSFIDLSSFYDELLKRLSQSNLRMLPQEELPSEPKIKTCDTVLPATHCFSNLYRGDMENVAEHAANDLTEVSSVATNEETSDTTPLLKSSTVEKLKEQLALGMQLIRQAVIANTAGNGLSRARGISIYYPHNRIDNSYFATEFAKTGLWLKFLQENI